MKSIINRRGSKSATRALKRMGQPQKNLPTAKAAKTQANPSSQPLHHKRGYVK